MLQQEMDRRWSAIQEMRRHRGYDAVLVPSAGHRSDGAFRYVTGLAPAPSSAYAVVLPDRAPVAVLSTATAPCVRGSQVDDIRRAADPVTEVADILSSTGAVERVGVTGLGDLLGIRDQRALLDVVPVDLDDATSGLDEIRAVKSAIEIEGLEEAAYIADRCFEHLLASARPGTTSRELWADTVRLATSLGADDVIGSTVVVEEHDLGGSSTCRSRPEGRAVLPRDLFVLTIAVMGPSGSWVELCRPIAFAPSDEPQERISGAAATAVETLVRRIRPGTTVAEIGRVLEETARDHRGRLVGRSGHGIGLGAVEHPRDVADADPDAILNENAALTLHPIVEDLDGRVAASMADTFVIEAGGARRLSEFPLGVYRPHVWARH